MRNSGKLALAGLTTTLLMAVAVDSASARSLSVSNQSFRIAWSSLTFFGEGTEIRCPVTLEGSFHYRTMAKVLGALLGRVTRAIFGRPCTGGSFTVLTETLPWHVTYEGFSGTLPRITHLRLLLRAVAFNVELAGTFGTLCLYGDNGEERSNAAGEAAREAGGAIHEFLFDNTIRFALIRTSGPFGGLCPRTLGAEGTGTVTLLGTTTRISLTLI